MTLLLLDLSLCHQFLTELIRCLGTILDPDIHGIHDGRFRILIDLHSHFGRRQKLIFLPSFHGILRCHARDHLVKGGTAGIDIRPGSLVATASVLFLRRKSLLDNDRKAATVCRRGKTCRTEIQQLYFACICNEDIIR